MRLEAAHLAGSQIGDHDDFSAEEFFRRIPLRNAGEDLALFITEIDFKAEKLVGLWNALGHDDLRDAKIDLYRVVGGDLWRIRNARAGGRGCESTGCGRFSMRRRAGTLGRERMAPGDQIGRV